MIVLPDSVVVSGAGVRVVVMVFPVAARLASTSAINGSVGLMRFWPDAADGGVQAARAVMVAAATDNPRKERRVGVLVIMKSFVGGLLDRRRRWWWTVLGYPRR
ncbi:hypothetical protein [Arthrobacter cryoconiti]|uniref:Secreted protein n=1 Tax=Arthrobacter cryoconiti TaxID=748907 RepID=A0ABV8R5F1_9MICC|nr:hypothetical protein [Arthrobacter cryoconiti]MCC9066759.1 hypothetical protein [Arthrobacter cryoconiti]